MNILIDNAMPYWRELFLPIGNVTAFKAGDLQSEGNKTHNQSLESAIDECEYLFVRSTTKVNIDLLNRMPNLKFVGTATAGFDHFDIEALEHRNIKWYASAGCNAQAVCQYMLSTILHLACVDKFSISDKTVTIIGYGQVGSRVAAAMQALGASIRIYDPPLQKEYLQHQKDKPISDFWKTQPLQNLAQEVFGDSMGFVSLDKALEADVICIHSPLNNSIEFNNYHLFDELVLSNLNSKQYLINAGRGEIVDNTALLKLFSKKKSCMPNVVLDVWENEPYVLRALTPFLRLATPHIAGHTLEGKAKGTFMLYQQLCKRENLAIREQFEDLIPIFDPLIPKTLLSGIQQIKDDKNNIRNQNSQKILLSLCNLAYLVVNDDRVFRQHMAQSPSFAKLRQDYPVRREFSAIHINTLNTTINELLQKLGFIISNDSRTSHI